MTKLLLRLRSRYVFLCVCFFFLRQNLYNFFAKQKNGRWSVFSSGADRNIGKAASGEARRESLRPPIRHAAALLKAGERCALARLWADCGHGGDAFITAVKIWQGRDAASSVCWRSQLPLKGKPLNFAFPLRGEGKQIPAESAG